MSTYVRARGRPLLRAIATIARPRGAAHAATAAAGSSTFSHNAARIALLRRQLLPLFGKMGASQYGMTLREFERRVASSPRIMESLKAGVPSHPSSAVATNAHQIRMQMKCTVHENNAAFTLTADLPNVFQDDVKVEVKENNLLSIAARTSSRDCDFIKVREIRLPRGVNLKEISAVLKDDVLTVRVSKQPSFKVVVEAPDIPTIYAMPEQLIASA